MVRRGNQIRNADAVRGKVRRDAGTHSETCSRWWATRPTAIPAFPGSGRPPRPGCSINTGRIEEFPATVLGPDRNRAFLFKLLATLRDDAHLFDDVDELRWHGATDGFTSYAEKHRCRPGVAWANALKARVSPGTDYQ